MESMGRVSKGEFSDLLCSRGGKNHKSLVMDVSRRPRTSVLPVFHGAFCIILAT